MMHSSAVAFLVFGSVAAGELQLKADSIEFHSASQISKIWNENSIIKVDSPVVAPKLSTDQLLIKPVSGETQPACDAASEGRFLFLNGTKTLEFCSSGKWITFQSTLGDCVGTPKSCTAIKLCQPSATSGIFTIRPEGASQDLQVYCEHDFAGGGWTLIAQRRGGADNSETCGSNLDAFFSAGCGSVGNLASTSSYAMTGAQRRSLGQEEVMIVQYEGGVADANDAYIMTTATDLFDTTSAQVDDIPVDKVCTLDGSVCDTSDVYFKFLGGNGYFTYTYCTSGFSAGYGGMYGLCHNGVSSQYYADSFSGDRTDYGQVKLWSHNSDGYQGTGFNPSSLSERIFVRSNFDATPSKCKGVPSSCKEHIECVPGSASGLVTVKLKGEESTRQVYCENSVANGGWTLIAQRRGGADNSETCGSNLDAFFSAGCGSVGNLASSSSYALSEAQRNSLGHSQVMVIQYAGSSADSDDAYIMTTDKDVFQKTNQEVDDIPVDKVCTLDGSVCDTSDVYFKFLGGNGYFTNAYCTSGFSAGYGGMYGLCHNGVSSQYYADSFSGDRMDYGQVKLWSHNSAGYSGPANPSSLNERIFFR